MANLGLSLITFCDIEEDNRGMGSSSTHMLFNHSERITMKNLPKIGELVVVNHLPDATKYRVVETDGRFGVGLIDSTIEKSVPNQAVQWIDVEVVKYPK